MTSRLLIGLLIILLLTLGSSASGEKNPRPNVIIIYLDDMGYGDLSLTGSTGYHTPNIDMIAAEGIFFSHYLAPRPSAAPAGQDS
ncbi:MAG: sulfatase-like hydrolase/transferase [Marinilabiliales bacterium]|nr:sulfatase-like hydrolase/transferase [Marinilabiliales bacterium]